MNSNSEINIIIIKNILNNIIDDVCKKSKILKLDKQNKILENECLICFEPITKNKDVILFECFHKYHAKCINDWTSFEDNNNNQFKTFCLLCKTSNFIIIPKHKIVKKKINHIEKTEIELTENKIKIINQTVQTRNVNDDLCTRRCIIC